MSNAKWSLFVGGLYAFLNLVAIFYFISGLLGLQKIGWDSPEIVGEIIDPDAKAGMANDDSVLVVYTRKQITRFTVELIIDIVMFVVSLLLIVGVRKKNYKFVAPWVYMFFVTLLAIFVGFFSKILTRREKFGRFIILFISTLLWYRVYKHYKYLRSLASKTSSPANESANVRFLQQPASAPVYESKTYEI